MRPEIKDLHRYEAGRDMDAVMREYGLDSIIKLASNECPYPPFEPVIKVIEQAASGVNRYPDNDYFALRSALSAHLGIDRSSISVGAGSSELLGNMALAVGGPDTTAVFAWPSFTMYPIATRVAGAKEITVPLDGGSAHDLGAMAAAIQDDTTLVYVCNPNNPTGTIRSGDEVEDFVRAVPSDVLVVIDEAYAEFVTDNSYRTMIPLAIELANVVVTRTFSKVYGLAGLRVGYTVGNPDLIADLQKPQAPFVVTAMGEAAAVEALKHQDLLSARVQENADERGRLERAFAERQIPYTSSQTNFIMTGPWEDGPGTVETLITKGVITRPIGRSMVRVTVGTPAENDFLLQAVDASR